ncbi:AidA/PixA family protein [Pseudomonas sp. R5(2019)]|uniref:AidA/PixA family protein n=1 Tax=Pseudomonas sp. R5(2019) TaxID=2697566 RepID=UPI0014125639|nr:hypothetical protein [Pseudomonas sp. R5(2019)]
MSAKALDRHILFIIDAERIISDHTNPSLSEEAPTSLDADYLFLQATRPEQWQGPAQQPFALAAQPGDQIYLRAAPVALRGEHIVCLNAIHFDDPEVVSAPRPTLRSGVKLATPSFEDLLKLQIQVVDDHCWSSEVQAPGTTGCEIHFLLLNQDCTPQGHYLLHLTLQFMS